LVHEVARAEELAERRRARSVDHAGLEVEEHPAGHVLAALGLVVQHADAAELCWPVLASHRVTALARLYVLDLARRSCLEARSTRKKKEREELRVVRNSSWHFFTGDMKYSGARARIPKGGMKWPYHSILWSCWRRAKRAGCRRVRSRIICFNHVPIAV
jgi:hypothetical protein